MKVTYEFDTARETDYNVLRDIGDLLNTKYNDVYVTKKTVPPQTTKNPPVPSPMVPSPTPPRGVCKVCGEERCGPGYDVCYGCHFDERDEIAGGTRRMREG